MDRARAEARRNVGIGGDSKAATGPSKLQSRLPRGRRYQPTRSQSVFDNRRPSVTGIRLNHTVNGGGIQSPDRQVQ